MTYEEITARLAAIEEELAVIKESLNTATGEELARIEEETEELLEERSKLMSNLQTRQQLRQSIASGAVTGTAIEKKEDTKMENRTFTPASEEYRSAFLKNLRREALNEGEQRAFTFLTTNTAAPLPTVMQNRIIDLIGEAHPIVADVFPLNSGAAISIPVGKSVKADAGKSAEGDAANELEIEFTDVNLSGEDYTANVKMSYKMLAMAIPAFEDYLITMIADRLGAKLAAGIVAKVKEVMNAGNKVTSGVSYANLVAGFGALKRVGAVVVYGTRETIFNKLVGMVDSNKRPIFQQAITEAAAGHLLGATIKFEDAVGANELLIGDPKKFVQNKVVDILIERDKDLDNHKVVFSGYTCQEGTLTDDKAFALVAEA